MGFNPKPVDPSRIVKIECLDPPEHFEKDEGYYELRWGDKPKEHESHDVVSIKEAIKKICPSRVNIVLDQLQNFRVVYLNLDTGEMMS